MGDSLRPGNYIPMGVMAGPNTAVGGLSGISLFQRNLRNTRPFQSIQPTKLAPRPGGFSMFRGAHGFFTSLRYASWRLGVPLGREKAATCRAQGKQTKRLSAYCPAIASGPGSMRIAFQGNRKPRPLRRRGFLLPFPSDFPVVGQFEKLGVSRLVASNYNPTGRAAHQKPGCVLMPRHLRAARLFLSV